MIKMEPKLEFLIGQQKDLHKIFSLIETTGWGESFADIKRAFDISPGGFLLLINEQTNELIGVAWIVSYGEIGFIGMVVVESKYRGKRIGQGIMEEAVALLKSKGCKTIKLDAVQKATSLYKRVGFKEELRSLRFYKEIKDQEKLIGQMDQKIKDQNSFKLVFNIKEHDIAPILQMDQTIFSGNRESLLIALWREYPDFSFIAQTKEGELAGYLFGTYQMGILKLRAGVAKDTPTITHLLKAAITVASERDDFQKISIGLPEINNEAIDILHELGFSQGNYSLRMFWGKKSKATIHPTIFAIGHPAKG
ncbi:MAG: GNAT family N-acetyltransferase [Candidatus Heimdallarchaeota archaeon]|nr:GNAT family N-acetyltransferase [Candidatus Heimdallarchaeota archaeon]